MTIGANSPPVIFRQIIDSESVMWATHRYGKSKGMETNRGGAGVEAAANVLTARTQQTPFATRGAVLQHHARHACLQI